MTPRATHEPRAAWRHALAPLALALSLTACATVPTEERLLTLQPGGAVAASSQPCGASRPATPASTTAGPASAALDPKALRIASWNLHKGEDAGWQADLARFAAEHDVLLLQEAVLTPAMREVLERASYTWHMVGAFAQGDEERGVMIATRIPPLESCTLRAFEPLFPLPKSAIVARYALEGHARPVAIANLHGINFTLGIGRFTEQLEAVAAELARHDGPAILAGDFNTWSQQRHDLLHAVAARLGLISPEFAPDGRRRTFGLHLDHLFVRGFTVARAAAPDVKSSDHNPILVELVLR
jgi:endonuclease/exonuclease/phosphatase (EEP) superfamily protein YafD